jgi:hypothetical protein
MRNCSKKWVWVKIVVSQLGWNIKIIARELLILNMEYYGIIARVENIKIIAKSINYQIRKY